MPHFLNEKTRKKLTDMIREGTIKREEDYVSDDPVSDILNGYVCGLCGERIKGKMWILSYDNGKAKTMYYVDDKCYQGATADYRPLVFNVEFEKNIPGLN